MNNEALTSDQIDSILGPAPANHPSTNTSSLGAGFWKAALSASSQAGLTLAQVGEGIAKGAGLTAINAMRGGETVANDTAGSVVSAIEGKGLKPLPDNEAMSGNDPINSNSPAGKTASSITTPHGFAQNLGFAGEKVGEFFAAPEADAEEGAVDVAENFSGLSRVARNTISYLKNKAVTGAGQGIASGVITGNQTGSVKQGIDAGILTAALGIPSDAAMKVVTKGGEIASGMAPRIVNSLIKPLLRDFSYGKNPGRAVAEEGITGTSLDDLASKIGTSVSKVGAQIGNIADKIGTGITRDASDVFKPIDDAIEKAKQAPRTNASVISRLNDLKSDLMGETTDENGNKSFATKLSGMTYKAAADLKTKIGELTRWTGNASDDKAVNAALKKVYGGIKGIMDDIASETGSDIASESKKLNEKYGDLVSAQIATQYRDKIESRGNLVSLATGHSAAVTAIGTALVTGGSGIATALAGVGGAVIDKALSSTVVKTNAAKWLAKADPEEIAAVLQKYPAFAEGLQKAGFAFRADVSKLLAGGNTQEGQDSAGDAVPNQDGNDGGNQ